MITHELRISVRATVVTLVLSAADATRIASAGGDVALVRLGG